MFLRQSAAILLTLLTGVSACVMECYPPSNTRSCHESSAPSSGRLPEDSPRPPSHCCLDLVPAAKRSEMRSPATPLLIPVVNWVEPHVGNSIGIVSDFPTISTNYSPAEKTSI